MVWGFGFRALGLGLGVWSLGFHIIREGPTYTRIYRVRGIYLTSKDAL